MNDTANSGTMDKVQEFLDHHGVKGQKWGVRNKTKLFKRVKKGSSIPHPSTLSDEELAKALKRMNMEQQYKSLNAKATTKKAGETFIKDIGKTGVKTAATAVVTYHVTQAFKKAKLMK